MAATDARIIPRKNAAYRLYLEFRDNTGALIGAAATSPDTEVSIDGGSFADCTNEFTDIGTTGCGYIDLTSSEMNGDAVYVKSTCTNTNAKPFTIVLYPQETGDIRVDIDSYKGTDSPAADTAGYPKVTIKSGSGTGELALTSGAVALTAAGNTAVVTELMGTVTENNGSLTFKTIMRVLAAICAGRVTISGPTVTFNTANNAKTRATVTTDANNQRTAVTLDGTD